MTKELLLNKGFATVVDDDDFVWLSRLLWFVCFNRSNMPYARTSKVALDGGTGIMMHRLILGAPPPEVLVDHRDGNGLNNCRGNLRLCTASQNIMNRRKLRPKTSRFKGVSWSTCQKRFRANIDVDKKRIHLGYFQSEEDAGRAYNEAAERYFGDFAHLNTF